MGRNLTFTFGTFASDSAVYPVREVLQDATDVPHKVRESRVLRVRVEQLRAVQKRVHELGVIRQRVRQDAVDDLEDDPHEEPLMSNFIYRLPRVATVYSTVPYCSKKKTRKHAHHIHHDDVMSWSAKWSAKRGSAKTPIYYRSS